MGMSAGVQAVNSAEDSVQAAEEALPGLGKYPADVQEPEEGAEDGVQMQIIFERCSYV